MRKIAAVCLTVMLIPYVTTLAWTGRADGTVQAGGLSGKTILLDREGAQRAVDLEEYLIGVAAVQIPSDFEMEAAKAQAIIARTAICRQMDGKEEIAESALDMDYLEQEQMEEIWGSEEALSRFKEIKDAVSETAGQVILYNGEYIEPLFTRLSTGRTRQGDEMHPYLLPVEVPEAIEGEGYMTVQIFTRDELAERFNSMHESPGISGDEIPDCIQIIEKDSSGYVKSVQVGTKTYTGDEIRYALDLPSPAFRFETCEDGVRCTVTGIGHGYGFDQFGANRKASEGWSAEEILKYFFSGISVESIP